MPYPRNYNAVNDLLDINIARGLGDKVAFVDQTSEITYQQLQDNTCKIANLLEQHNIRRETRIGILMHDSVHWPAVFLGAIRGGIIPVAMNTLLASEPYRYILEDSRAEVLFISAPLLSVITPILDQLGFLKKIFVVGEFTDNTANTTIEQYSYADQILNQPTSFTTVETCSDEIAFWLYSSGSTGTPKGVPHLHTSMMETAKLFGQGVLAMEENDIVFSAAKFFFAYGLGNALSFPMSVGATTVLWSGRPTPDDMYDTLTKHQPTIFYGVPTLYAAMLASPRCHPHNASAKLRLCVSAGEALPQDVGEKWSTIFGVDIIDGVGSTELLHIFLSNAPDDVSYGASGVAVPGYTLRLVGEDGSEVGEDEIGELLVDGPSTTPGYWNQHEKNRTTFEGRWARTGDKYYRNAEGKFVYCGRTDDMFKVSGQWVSPFEVESALISHPAVLEAAVVGFEDQDGLTKPRAFVVLHGDQLVDMQSPEDLTSALVGHVKQSIGRWKYPREIRFVDDLPKTATGKIQRFKLRD